MKIPCEVVVWYILPIIRREVARELVNEHGLTQAQVARKFGVTDAAISQYLKKKRGVKADFEKSKAYSAFLDEISKTADNLANEKSLFEAEMCRLCGVVKRIGLLDEVYLEEFGVYPPECGNFCVFHDVKA